MQLALSYKRRYTTGVSVGNITIGGNNHIVIQSMTNTPTLDTDASVAQIKSLSNAGAELVRLTAQGVNHARNLAEIVKRVRYDGYDTPISADIHFNPAAAFEAALHVDKVRINPGNFADPARTFKKLSYTDQEYAGELQRIEQALVPLLDRCAQHNTALRLGVNHGSLSDRIMSRFGDTPRGMVESAMEYLRICHKHNFKQVVLSVKSSNVVVMTQTVRLLVNAMDSEGMHYPLHLGVTEAGNAEEARIKSAVGIGSLLADGIGDTIRVSLAEPPENEIPVAKMIVGYIDKIAKDSAINGSSGSLNTDYLLTTGKTIKVIGHEISADEVLSKFGTIKTVGGGALYHIRNILQQNVATNTSGSKVSVPAIEISYPETMTSDEVLVAASIDFGSLILSGIIPPAIGIKAKALTNEEAVNLVFGILQATRQRFTKTEYIACPGCGRTLFDLSSTLNHIKRATSHLTNLKIGVMGCVVNGPGEMADADYGYVGAAAGHISLYKQRTCVKQNIPAECAVNELIALIKENGDWLEPQSENSNDK